MVDTAFPQNITNTIPANIHIFPSAFYIDATHDGTKDLIVTTNMQNNSENKESCWLYENSGTNSTPDFNFIQKDFLQGSGIDLGENAHPTFYDENGLTDCSGSKSCLPGNTGSRIDSNLGWLLGFRQPKYTITKKTSTKPGYITSEAVVNPWGTRYLLLEVDDLNRNRNSGNLISMYN